MSRAKGGSGKGRKGKPPPEPPRADPPDHHYERPPIALVIAVVLTAVLEVLDMTIVNVSIPPLRDRITELPALARHLLSRIAEQPGMRPLSITDDALAVLMEGKTVIVIAHRLSTIMKMDRIIVLEGGKIVADGTHEKLLAEGGLYQKLWSIQAGGFLGEDDVENEHGSDSN